MTVRDNAPASPPPWRRRTIPVTAGLAAWALLLLVFSTQYYVALTAAGQDVTWLSQFRRELPGWALWAGLSPLIFLVAGRLPLQGGARFRRLLLHLPIAAAMFVLYLLLYNLTLELIPLRPDVTESGLSFTERMVTSAQLNFASFFLIYIGVIAVYYLLNYHRAYRLQELETSRLHMRLTQARLDALQMQLQPHFLFNTLHGISALMEQEPKLARRMVANLSDLLRTSIEQDDNLVPLRRETETLNSYLAIQKMRFGNRLQTEIDIRPDCLDWPVPRFLLQPLVENSIQHGIGKRSGAGRVTVAAACDDTGLQLRVVDDGPGFPDGGFTEGLGLGNTRARLTAIYGEGYELDCMNSNDGAIVVLRLPRVDRIGGPGA